MDETKATHDPRKPLVTLYTRPGCHLCDEAKQAMHAARCEGQYTLREINIDLSPDLTRRYGWDIPVVLINGVVTFKHRLTPSDFKRELQRAIDSAD
ncbi:MAG TPA: glutaredoxin family protein [Pyrinomonadaceae bacterium]|nr:glutaredoxin family protein [Pyrinomonadaceae bacterium]